MAFKPCWHSWTHHENSNGWLYDILEDVVTFGIGLVSFVASFFVLLVHLSERTEPNIWTTVIFGVLTLSVLCLSTHSIVVWLRPFCHDDKTCIKCGKHQFKYTLMKEKKANEHIVLSKKTKDAQAAYKKALENRNSSMDEEYANNF